MPRSETARPGKRPLRALSVQEKIDAIKRVHDGESKAAVARDIGVPESTLRGWCKSEHKIRSQAKNLGSFEQAVSSPSDSDRSTPSGSPSGSNLPAGGANMSSSSTRDPSSEEPEPGPAMKRLRMENGMTSTATGSMGTQVPHAQGGSYNGDLNGQMINCQNLYNFLGNSEIGKNVLAMQEQLAMLQKQNSLISMFSSAPVVSSSSSTVGLIENGLQYTRSNGALTNNANKRKHNTSLQDTKSSTRRQSSLSPKMERSPGTSGIISTPSTSSGLVNGTQADLSISKSIATKQDRKCLELITNSLGAQQYMQLQQQHQQQQQIPTDLLNWYCKIYAMSMQPVPANVRNYVGRQNVEKYICNNNNVANQSDNETEDIDDSTIGSSHGLDEAIHHGDEFVNWLEHHGSSRFTFKEMLQVRKILDVMKRWSTKLKTDAAKKLESTAQASSS